MKIALIGKNGQLGWEFQHMLPALGEVISLGRDELDVSDLQAVQTILMDLQPELIVNASAYTNVDQAEIEPALAMQVNAQAPGVMAEIAHKIGAVLIHYSTDYVFDGEKTTPYIESDMTNPLNVYGKSKCIGEENIKQVGNAFLILRTSWVYSLRGNSFVSKVLGWSRKNTILKIVSDQISNPTWARKLAETTTQAIITNKANFLDILRDKRGVYHLAGGGYTSRFEWAEEILACDPNRSEQLVQSLEPASSKEFPTPAQRPLFTALNCTKFEESFGLHLPQWEQSLPMALTD